MIISEKLSKTIKVVNEDLIYFGDNYADKPVNRGALYAACGYFGSSPYGTGCLPDQC